MKNIKTVREAVKFMSKEFKIAEIFLTIDLLKKTSDKELYIRCFFNRFLKFTKFDFNDKEEVIVHDGETFSSIYDIKDLEMFTIKISMQRKISFQEIVEFNCKFLELEALGRK